MNIGTVDDCVIAFTDHRSFPTLIGLLLLTVLLCAGYRAHQPEARGVAFYLSVLVAACGVGLGILAASLASPLASSEATTFNTVAGIATSFATGFLLKTFEAQFAKTSIATLVNSVRFWMFVAAFIGGGLVTYVFRAYYSSPDKERIAVLEKASRDIGKLIGEVSALKLTKTEQPIVDHVSGDLTGVLSQLSFLQPANGEKDSTESKPFSKCFGKNPQDNDHATAGDGKSN